MTLTASHSIWATPVVLFLVLLPAPCWGLEMQLVPTSISVFFGKDATIPCNFQTEHNEKVNITWVLYQNVVNQTTTTSSKQKKTLESVKQNLIISGVKKSDSGVYVCRVTSEGKTYESCGTYLRVREHPVYLFFNVEETTKNQLITAEGIILLLCAIIPGTFLLYKKRLENFNSMSLDKGEGENIYEGLNLEDCSLYEDISRGLQATYEDVGTLRITDIQLEKP